MTTNTETFPALFEGDFAQIDHASHRGQLFLVKAAPGLGSRRTKFLLSPVHGGQDISVPVSMVLDSGSPLWRGPRSVDALQSLVSEAATNPPKVLREGALVRLSSAKFSGVFVLTQSTKGKWRAISLDGSVGVRGITDVSVAEVIAPSRVTITD